MFGIPMAIFCVILQFVMTSKLFLPYDILKKYICLCIWKAKWQRGREGQITHLLIHSSNACNRWGWARLEPGAQSREPGISSWSQELQTHQQEVALDEGQPGVELGLWYGGVIILSGSLTCYTQNISLSIQYFFRFIFIEKVRHLSMHYMFIQPSFVRYLGNSQLLSHKSVSINFSTHPWQANP